MAIGVYLERSRCMPPDARMVHAGGHQENEHLGYGAPLCVGNGGELLGVIGANF